MDPARLKADAGAALAAGQFARAGSLYAAYCASSPRDRQSHLRMGDAWARAGEKQRAIDAYLAAAHGFADDGFLARAIAASKLVLELDPHHTQMPRILADLYSRRAAGGQALRSLLSNGSKSAQPPADRGTPPAPPPSVVAPDVSASEPGLPPTVPTAPVLVDLMVTEYVLEPDAAEPTLERTLEDALTAPQPFPPRFVELSLEDAGGGGIPLEPLEPSESGEPRYIDLAFDEEPAAASQSGSSARAEPVGEDALEVSRTVLTGEPLLLEPDLGPLIHALERVAEEAPSEPIVARNPFVAPTARNVPRAPLFSDLSHEAFVELVERSPLRRFQGGERILQQGQPGDSFFVICEGRVSVLREDDGVAKPVAALEAGEFFGEVALLSGGPRTASVDAIADDTQVLEIPAAVLVELARRHAGVAAALKTFCRQRLLSNLLATSPLFRPLERTERRELAARFRARDALIGEDVLTEDKRGDGLYVVLAGEMEVLREGMNIGSLGTGDVFGEMSLLDEAPAVATVRALRRTSLLRLPILELGDVLERFPAVRHHLEALRDARTEINARLPLVPGDEPLLVV
jgi:CRP-like cAMP-binding protein